MQKTFVRTYFLKLINHFFFSPVFIASSLISVSLVANGSFPAAKTVKFIFGTYKQKKLSRN